VAIPKGTKYLKFQVDMTKGKDGNHGLIISQPYLSNEKAGDTLNFHDVSARYKTAVDFVVSKGVNGLNATTFGTNQNIKRVDAAVMLVRVLGLNTETAPASGFKDVPARAVKHINALKAAGITSGKTATRFDSSSEITRGELSIWIQRGFKLREGNKALPFKDVGDRYDGAVSALVSNGITNGTSPTTFGTNNNAKRGDYAIFLYRATQAK
ncbi:MAG: S-layer homology domain-containing protein, partial [Rickettsia endosymbiont of Ixodes persulcatus]|nr:S-layer homology domain-containing protein [Rickettsia endosymbiont of Ixodes persulcatus]